MIQEPLPPILRRIDLEHDLDLALALRRAGRPKRQAASLKGWATRRDSRLKPLVETACGLDAKHESGGSRREIAQSQQVNPSNNPPKSNTETAA